MKPSFLRKRREGGSENASSDDISEENPQDDGGENGGQDQQPPKPVGFWDHRLKHVRLEAMRKWVYTSVLNRDNLL
jgi:hypothetical protein